MLENSSLPAPPRSAQDQADLTDLLVMLYRDLEKQLARADTKAGLILTANSILLAVSVNVVVMYARQMDSAINLLWPLLSLIPALLLSGFALNCALSVAYPRANPILRTSQLSLLEAGGWFNPATIAASAQSEYLARFLRSDLEDVRREALRSVHAKASILQVKFNLVRRGILSTVAAFFAWLLFVVVTLVLM